MMKQREEHQPTTGKKVWLVTGAGRGMGVDIAKAALAAGHAVIATGRDTKAVEKALGRSNDLLVVKLDVTRLADAEAASRAAVDRLGRIAGFGRAQLIPNRWRPWGCFPTRD